MRSSSSAWRAFRRGWARVLRAPRLVAGTWLATALSAIPAAIAVQSAIASQLGRSLTAGRVATSFDHGWWQEFLAQATGPATTLSPSIIGAAAPLSTWSNFLDDPGVPAVLLTAVVSGLLVWVFLTGGLVDRLARDRPVGTRAFFGACGVFFFRFLRLTVLAGLAYWLLAVPFHGLLFDRLYPWLTRDTSVERTAFFWRVLIYIVWLVPVIMVNVVADYAKVRAVVEDRRSMIGAVVAAARFLRRHGIAAVLVYGGNILVMACALAVYAVFAPGARGGGWHALAAIAAGQAWIVTRIATRLAFLSSSTALVQQEMAHVEFTAPPLPVWPDSPAAEGIDNAARFGLRPQP